MVTNTNKQDISEFFLWLNYSPLTPGERLQSWKLGIRSPVPAPSLSMGRMGAGTSRTTGTISLSLAVG